MNDFYSKAQKSEPCITTMLAQETLFDDPILFRPGIPSRIRRFFLLFSEMPLNSQSGPSESSVRYCLECVIKVFNDVLYIFCSDGETDGILCNSLLLQLFLIILGMRR